MADEGVVMRPDGSVTPLQPELSWRERYLAKVCGDKRLVLCIRPSGYGGWLYLEKAEDIVDHLIEGEPGDEWELTWTLMTPEEIEAMPEHPGW